MSTDHLLDPNEPGNDDIRFDLSVLPQTQLELSEATDAMVELIRTGELLAYADQSGLVRGIRPEQRHLAQAIARWLSAHEAIQLLISERQ